MLKTAILVLALAQVPTVEIRFSPRGGCTELVAQAIGGAEHEVLVSTYQLTSRRIVNALVQAAHRGVTVRVVVDRSQELARASGLPAIRAARIPARIDRRHRIQHNKVVVLDGRSVVTGSFNFSASAEELNAENVLLLHDRGAAQRFRQDFEQHWQHAQP